MSRHLGLTQERILKLQKEGRGIGEGASYKPWIQVDNFASQGDATVFKIYSPAECITFFLI